MQVLNGYIAHIRPLLKPTCAHVLVTRNGGQHNKLRELMSKLVFDATASKAHEILEKLDGDEGSELQMDVR